VPWQRWQQYAVSCAGHGYHHQAIEALELAVRKAIFSPEHDLKLSSVTDPLLLSSLASMYRSKVASYKQLRFLSTLAGEELV
jgi:hypothetical protein